MHAVQILKDALDLVARQALPAERAPRVTPVRKSSRKWTTVLASRRWRKGSLWRPALCVS